MVVNEFALQLQDLISKLSEDLGLAPSTILETSDVSAICEIMPKTEEELNLILSDQKVRICGKEVLKIINGKSTNSTITTTTIKPVMDLSMDDDFQENEPDCTNKTDKYQGSQFK